MVRSKIHPSAFIAETAIIIGDVVIGRDSSVWFNAVVRGDVAPVVIGERTNVQDLCIIHADLDYPTTIGNEVTLGHGAVVHGATIEDNVLISIHAVVLNGAVVGENSIVGAGAVVTEGTVIPPHSLVLGIPGRVVGEINEGQLELIHQSAEHYVRYAKGHKSG